MKVLKKQTNSSDCIVCGMNNELGLKVQFYEMENGYLVGCFKGINEHQSFPGRMHGGVISAILDEGIGRAIWSFEPNTWGVTTHLNVKYRKPVPYGTLLVGKGVVTAETARAFEVDSFIYDQSGTLLANGHIKYMRLAPEIISSGADVHEEMPYLINDNVTEI